MEQIDDVETLETALCTALCKALRERDQYKAERDEARRKEVAASELLHSAKHILEHASMGSDITLSECKWMMERDECADRESA